MKKWAVRIIGIDDDEMNEIDYVWGLYETKEKADAWACCYNSNIRGFDGVSVNTTAWVVMIGYPASAPDTRELEDRIRKDGDTE